MCESAFIVLLGHTKEGAANIYINSKTLSGGKEQG